MHGALLFLDSRTASCNISVSSIACVNPPDSHTHNIHTSTGPTFTRIHLFCAVSSEYAAHLYALICAAVDKTVCRMKIAPPIRMYVRLCVPMCIGMLVCLFVCECSQSQLWRCSMYVYAGRHSWTWINVCRYIERFFFFFFSSFFSLHVHHVMLSDSFTDLYVFLYSICLAVSLLTLSTLSFPSFLHL